VSCEGAMHSESLLLAIRFQLLALGSALIAL
jgi:hypothetical protein